MRGLRITEGADPTVACEEQDQNITSEIIGRVKGTAQERGDKLASSLNFLLGFPGVQAAHDDLDSLLRLYGDVPNFKQLADLLIAKGAVIDSLTLISSFEVESEAPFNYFLGRSDAGWNKSDDPNSFIGPPFASECEDAARLDQMVAKGDSSQTLLRDRLFKRIDTLIAAGKADPNVPTNTYGMQTPLFFATEYSSIDLFQKLMKIPGIDVNQGCALEHAFFYANSYSTVSPSVLADFETRSWAIFTNLLSAPVLQLNKRPNGSNGIPCAPAESAFYARSYNPHDPFLLKELATLVQDPRLDVNQRGTLLWTAIHQNDVEALMALLTRKDLQVNIVPIGSSTSALSFAIDQQMPELVQALLTRNDLDVNFPDSNGTVPLTHVTSLPDNIQQILKPLLVARGAHQ